jgi:anaphase-promoting complex subunit 3
MTPPDPYIANQFRHLIYYHLDNGLTKNALFVAGRLFAFEPRSQEASYLLALCHLRLDQYKTAYEISRTSGAKGVNLGCVYVFAQACLALDRHQEGIRALERARGLWASRNNWSEWN